MLVSIIIPYYKDKNNIKFSVLSALQQTYRNTEIIIIDNENSLSSRSILNKILKKSKKIKIFNNKFLNYAGVGRNLGISYSKGDLIAFLDSDDLWSKEKLKLQVNELINKKIDILFTNYKAIDVKKKILYSVKSPSIITFKDLIQACPVCLSSSLIRKKCFENNKFKNLKTKEDYELWLNFSKSGYRIRTLNHFLTFYRVRSSSLSSLHINKIKNAFLIYYEFQNFSTYYSIFCVLRLYYNAFKKKFCNYEKK